MKTGKDNQNNLFDNGRQTWERTNAFRKKTEEVKLELKNKRELRLRTEKNWFKRQLIRLQYFIELKKRTNEISSAKNLHVISGWR